MRSITLPARLHLPLGAVALVLVLAVFAILSGAATAFAGTWAVIVFGGIAAGAAALLLPLSWLLVGLFVVSFVVVGQLVYFAGISKAVWIPFLAGLLLLVRYPIDMMQRNRFRSHDRYESSTSSFVMKCSIGLFFATLFASTLIHASPPIQVLVTYKEYVFLWGLYLVLAAGLVRTEFVERIWASLPWLMVLQLPLILYQRFVVMGSTRAQAKWDVIVGAFGGNPDGGGASGAMGIFCLIGIVTAITRYQAKLVPCWQMLLLVLSGLLAIALAEVKFMILLLPVCFGMLFARELTRNPFKGLLLVSLGFIVAVGITIGYKSQYAGYNRQLTVEQYAEEILKGETETSYVNTLNRTQGRISSLVFWYKQQKISDPASLLIGHGAGSSRITMTFVGEAQAKYFQSLARSTLAIMLWEIGLIGTLLYLAMLGSACVTLWLQSRDPSRSAESRATLRSMSAATILLAASLPYDQNLLFSYQLQLLLLVSVGYAAMVSQHLASKDRTGARYRPVPRRFST